MTPILLKMIAFGPYADEQSIDFSAFGQSPMFLINGVTGAGKSTILDAICFALYGVTSGDDREVSGMRSAMANTSVLSEVEFVFQIGDKRWKIRRVPMQSRPKSRGEGLTVQQPEAQLYEVREGQPDQLIVAKKANDATAKIQSLTGLNASQFRQVMVLPQGQFRALLLAKSTEREMILSTLFGTEVYKRIEDQLKEQARLIQARFDSGRNEIQSLLETVGSESKNSLVSELNEKTIALDQATAKLSELTADYEFQLQNKMSAEALAASFSQFDQLVNEGKKLEIRKNELVPQRLVLQRAESANELSVQWQHYERASQDVKTCKQNIEQQQEQLNTDIAKTAQLSSALDSQINEYQRLNRLRSELQILEQNQKRLLSAEPIKQQLQSIDQEVAKAVQGRDHFLSELQSMTSTIGQWNEQIEELKTGIGSNEELKEALILRRTVLEKRKKLTLLDEELQTIKDARGKNQRDFEASELTIEREHQSLKQLEFRWHRSQAAFLAQELEMDTPCPVCGSPDHPAPADQSEDTVGEPDIKKQKLVVDKLAEQHQQISVQLSKLEVMFDRICQDRIALMDELDKDALISESDLSQEIGRLEAKVAEIATKSKKLEKHENEVKTLAGKVSEIQPRIDKLKQQVITLEKQQIELQTRLKQVLEGIPDEQRNAKTVDHLISEQQRVIAKIESDYKTAQESFEQAKDVQARSEATLYSLSDQLGSLESYADDQHSAWEKALSLSEFNGLSDFNASKLEPERLQILQSELSDFDDELVAHQGALDHHQQLLEHEHRPDLKRIELELVGAKEKTDEALKLTKELQFRQKTLESALDRLTILDKEHGDLQTQYGVMGRLATIASGQPPAKVNFQRFVLGVLLDDVLLEASRRLLRMSKGRYELVRSNPEAGRRVSGLDLDIIDAHTGKSRSVNTLSGGESFMAALAMALGLSDVVQAYSGGIRLETLFIDEGFGSLDPDSLDLAVQTLTELQANGRMIGIISHVESMKEQIHQRIDIVQNTVGSKIKLAV